MKKKKFKVVNTGEEYLLYVRRYYLEGWTILEWVVYTMFICIPILPILFETLDNNLPLSFVYEGTYKTLEEIAERTHQIRQSHKPRYF